VEMDGVGSSCLRLRGCGVFGVGVRRTRARVACRSRRGRSSRGLGRSSRDPPSSRMRSVLGQLRGTWSTSSEL
jgi:hypothetical protein